MRNMACGKEGETGERARKKHMHPAECLQHEHARAFEQASGPCKRGSYRASHALAGYMAVAMVAVLSLPGCQP